MEVSNTSGRRKTAVARIYVKAGNGDILINNKPYDQYFTTLVNQFKVVQPLQVTDNIGKLDIKINVDGVFFVARAVGRRMIVRNRGKIVNIGSVQSELGRPTIVPYTATKGAVKMMTKGLCAEWAKHGIQVNAIAPGYFVTELNKALVENKDFSDWLCKRTPAGRWGNVEELVGAAIFLSSMASNFVNGHVLMVDGGLTASV